MAAIMRVAIFWEVHYEKAVTYLGVKAVMVEQHATAIENKRLVQGR
jgi:hypothetical protein